MPNATLRPLPEGAWSDEHTTATLDEIRSFIGIEPPARALDSVLATVLFTDIVGSTAKDFVPGSGLAFEDAGEHELKGVPDHWHLYREVK